MRTSKAPFGTSHRLTIPEFAPTETERGTAHLVALQAASRFLNSRRLKQRDAGGTKGDRLSASRFLNSRRLKLEKTVADAVADFRLTIPEFAPTETISEILNRKPPKPPHDS